MPGDEHISEMVERVARAICSEEWNGDAAGIEWTWRHYLPFARAALTAMREPTKAMITYTGYAHSKRADQWRAMIDEALRSA